ncbi:adenosine deaminase [Cellulosilyticum sp. I15G10I2]|uniref:adenosine deaminase n=1 Tax=Cellulosilyticum sp. I15G10I2 TaxID=1892843 RepID=UPI00085C196D|nr:adenosine deaminase [Cellulosilyticum sp. I15G10I2]
MRNESWIQKLPKIDLHCHLDGSMGIEAVREQLARSEFLLPDDRLKDALQVSENCTSLTEYLKKFELPLKCLQTEKGLKAATLNLLKQAAAENIKYIEIRFAPLLSVNQTLDCRQVIESVVSGLQEGEKRYAVHGGIIVCAMRHHTAEKNIEMLKTARVLLGHGVCALDLAGDESAYPTQMQRELFYKAKQWDMPFTIHSGECGSVENVKEAIELGARRLGHGIALRKSEALIKLCRQKQIGIEMCPSSNLQTKAIDSWHDYPLELFLEKGLLATINTDNRTVSNTSITEELMLVYENMHYNKEVIINLLKNAAEVSFAKDHVKNELLSALHKA